MKIITFENRNDLNEISFHDCCFYDYCYSYGERIITLRCDNDWLKKEFKICFNNVVYHEMIGCCFWGDESCYINWAGYSPCETIFEKLSQLQAKADEKRVANNKGSGFDSPFFLLKKTNWNSGIQYVPMLFEFASGDTLIILAEEIVVEVHEW